MSIFLLIILKNKKEKRLREITNEQQRQMIYLLSNSVNLLFNEIYRDQSGEFVCGY